MLCKYDCTVVLLYFLVICVFHPTDSHKKIQKLFSIKICRIVFRKFSNHDKIVYTNSNWKNWAKAKLALKTLSFVGIIMLHRFILYTMA